MTVRPLPPMIVALLFAGSTAVCPTFVRADELLTISDLQAALVEAREVRSGGSRLAANTPRPAPGERIAESPVLPLLQIPTVSEAAPPSDSKPAAAKPFVIAAGRIDTAASSTGKRNASLDEIQRLQAAPLNVVEKLPRLLLMTVIVLAVCVSSLWFVQRWLKRSGRIINAVDRPRLQIVATLSLASRSQLHLVRFDDREVLVGVDARGLRKLEILSPPFDTVLESLPTSEPSTTGLEELRGFRNVHGTGRSLAAA